MIEIGIGPNLVDVQAGIHWLISWHGFFSFIAVGTAVYLVGRWAPMRGIDPDVIYSIALWAIIGGFIGARFVHVIDNWSIYSGNVGQMFAIWSGGVGVWGGILGGFIGGAIYAYINKHPIGVIADLTAPAMLIVQTIGRLGDIVNGEHCAKATDWFIGFVWTNPDSLASSCANGVGSGVHPVIAYEMIWNMIALGIIWKLRGRIKPDGMLYALYLALYSIGRFAVTFARDDKVWALGMQEAHYIALVTLAITVPLLAFKARFVQRAPEEELVTEYTQTEPRGTRAQRRRSKRR
ncbi:MAG: prolipoprotein diacylglyceryl transferase [Chloroflexi bacterium]|nr:prolipoprotein diacylglyceryl transferase [Chloroflexota bacterium]